MIHSQLKSIIWGMALLSALNASAQHSKAKREKMKDFGHNPFVYYIDGESEGQRSRKSAQKQKPSPSAVKLKNLKVLTELGGYYFAAEENSLAILDIMGEFRRLLKLGAKSSATLAAIKKEIEESEKLLKEKVGSERMQSYGVHNLLPQLKKKVDGGEFLSDWLSEMNLVLAETLSLSEKRRLGLMDQIKKASDPKDEGKITPELVLQSIFDKENQLKAFEQKLANWKPLT